MCRVLAFCGRASAVPRSVRRCAVGRASAQAHLGLPGGLGDPCQRQWCVGRTPDVARAHCSCAGPAPPLPE
eukprot:14374990-Alexandrium_andersonii.AAC.1